jgi:hypothetical protein
MHSDPIFEHMVIFSPPGKPFYGAVGELLGRINGYSYANGNPVNIVDPSGMQGCLPGINCSTPPNPGISTNSQWPFTPITPIPVNPPNYGDFPPDRLWNTCMWFNGAMCPGTNSAPWLFGIESPFGGTIVAPNLGSISIPIPRECEGTECADYLERLLSYLATLTAATLATLATEFTIYGDGGMIPSSGIQITTDDIFREITPGHPLYPYALLFGSRVISLPALTSNGDYYTPTGRTANHVYIEFRLGLISKVYDNYHPTGDGSIYDFQSQLQGVAWRNCRRYQGLNLGNLILALRMLPILIAQAQGFGRIPSENRLMTGNCPPG